MFVICEPGTYQLQTGQGPLSVDPGCGSSHCELLNQTTMATLVVVRPSPYGSQDVQVATLVTGEVHQNQYWMPKYGRVSCLSHMTGLEMVA